MRCGTCKMELHDAGEFHPEAFCVLNRAGIDPWQEILALNEWLGLVPSDALPKHPPLVRDLPSVLRTEPKA